MFSITICGIKFSFKHIMLFRKNYRMLRKVFIGSRAAGIALGLTMDNLEVVSTDNIIRDIMAKNILQTREIVQKWHTIG